MAPSTDPAQQSDDPILVRRAKIDRLTSNTKRVGYSMLGAACVLFFVGFFGGFNDTLVNIIVGLIVVSSIILAPAIVFAYGVKAANREDAGGGSFH